MNIFDKNSITIDSVRSLIASKDDTEMRQVRIRDDGEIFLSDDVGNSNEEGIRLFFETWSADGYCGPEAALDEKWVSEVYGDLLWIYDNNKTGYFDGRY